MVNRKVADAMLFGSTYVFPLVAFPLLTWAWWREGGWPLAAFLMGVPLIFGYVMPGIGTNVMKRWRFTGPWRIGDFYVHHGFVYASKMTFVLWLAAREPTAVVSWLDGASVILLVGGMTAFGGWWHDLYAVRTGRIQFLGEPPAGRRPEDVVTSFAPTTFFVLGATYAVVGVAGARLLAAGVHFGAVFFTGLVVLCVVPSLTFLALDPGAYRSFRTMIMRRSTDGS